MYRINILLTEKYSILLKLYIIYLEVYKSILLNNLHKRDLLMNKINLNDEILSLTRYIENVKTGISSHNEYLIPTTSVLTHMRTLHDQFINDCELKEYNELKIKLMDNITQLINSYNNHNNNFNIDEQCINDMRTIVTSMYMTLSDIIPIHAINPQFVE